MYNPHGAPSTGPGPGPAQGPPAMPPYGGPPSGPPGMMKPPPASAANGPGFGQPGPRMGPPGGMMHPPGPPGPPHPGQQLAGPMGQMTLNGQGPPGPRPPTGPPAGPPGGFPPHSVPYGSAAPPGPPAPGPCPPMGMGGSPPPRPGFGPPPPASSATGGPPRPPMGPPGGAPGGFNRPPASSAPGGFGPPPPASAFGQQPVTTGPASSYPSAPPSQNMQYRGGPPSGHPMGAPAGPPRPGMPNAAGPPSGPGLPGPPTGLPGMMPPRGPGGPPPHGGMRPGMMPPPPGGPGMAAAGPGGMPPPPSSMPGSFPPPPGGSYPPSGMPPAGPPGMMPPGGAPQSPGYGPGPAGYPAAGPMGAGPMAGPQGPKKLDPDSIPSPIQVIEDDKKTRTGLFSTGPRGCLPPLVTTDFVCSDEGNCNPRLMRSTMYTFPCTSDLAKQCSIPIGLAISPFAHLGSNERPLPVVDTGELGPVRCNRCKAYMCPFMLFIDGGRRFQCPFCGCTTDVPQEYFNHLDHTGRRMDVMERPELCLGAYEMIATKEYCKNNKMPNPPAFIFMIDVSYSSIKSGLVHLLAARLKDEVLTKLPKDVGRDESEIRVGFVTYDRELHFYNVKGNLAQPQMLTVADINDVFLPLLEGFLVKLSEAEPLIDSLLSQLPQLVAENRQTETVLGPVIQAGLEAMKAADCSGKLIIFHSGLPQAEAPGKLKNREDRKLLGTDKEKTLLTPQMPFYTRLGEDCVAAGCSVDLYLTPNMYIDVATIGDVCKISGGQLYKYMYFQADLEGDRLMSDLAETVSRPIAFDAIMRVRTSTGIRPTDFYGSFHMANTTDMEVGSIDSYKSVAVELKHDDKLSEEEGALAQAAILYTSSSGQRRLRVLNLSVNCSSQFADIYRSVDLDAVVNVLAKQSLTQLLTTDPQSVRSSLASKCAAMLACYRRSCTQSSGAGQLILPELMKLLPVYVNSLLKCDAISGGAEVPTDDRSYLILAIYGMGIAASHAFIYPRLISVHNMDPDDHNVPAAIRCSYERLSDQGVYLLENGLTMYIWIGLNVSPDWVSQVFGVNSAAQIDIEKAHIPNLDNPVSERLNSLIRELNATRRRHMKLTIVRQRDKLEPWFQHLLVEDKGFGSSSSYVDFLCHVHREIRNLLN